VGVSVSSSGMAGRLIALYEMLINGLLGLCSVDVDRGEVLSMRVTIKIILPLKFILKL